MYSTENKVRGLTMLEYPPPVNEVSVVTIAVGAFGPSRTEPTRNSSLNRYEFGFCLQARAGRFGIADVRLYYV